MPRYIMNDLNSDLCQNEQFQNILIEITNDGILIIQNGECGYVNHSFTRTTGFTLEDMDKNRLFRIFPDRHYRAAIEKFRSGIEGYSNPLSFHTSIETGNGLKKELSISSYTVFHHQGPAVIAVIRDITDHREAEKERDQVLERFKTITGIMEQYVYFTEYLDDEPILSYHNPMSYEITGFKPEAFLENPGLIKKIIHGDDLFKVNYFMDKSREEQSTETFSHRIVHSNGSIRTVRHRFVTRRDNKTRYETGFILGMAGRADLFKKQTGAVEGRNNTHFLLPVCSECNRIKDEHGKWIEMELEAGTLSNTRFTHSLCPECARKLYGHQKWFRI